MKTSNYTEYEFFWHGPFSQWYYAPFQIDGRTINYAETYMMFYKDQMFSGGKLADEILNADRNNDPAKVKKLGRQVENFDKEIWDESSGTIVFLANYHKFKRNDNLRKLLSETKGKLLVEASPYDRIWGIGYSETEAIKVPISEWGENRLGWILTEVRELICKK